MKIKPLFFSTLREKFQIGEKEIEVTGSPTAQEVFLNFFQDAERGRRFLHSTRCAVNCEYVPAETLLKEGDEVAFIPPVSGG